MQTQEARDRVWLFWSVALEGVFGGIIVSFVFVARGDLHPVLALPLIGLGVLGALTRAVLVGRSRRAALSTAADASGGADRSP